MRTIIAAAAAAGVLVLATERRSFEAGWDGDAGAGVWQARAWSPGHSDAAALDDVIQRYCQVCHNDRLMTGNLSLEAFRVEAAHESPVTAEKMIRKLRAGMMPPPGVPRPAGDTLDLLIETLERVMDDAAAGSPNPGRRSFQRLNRTEYEQSIRDLLDLEVDAGAYLPLDTKSANFDNIADAQPLSATLLGGYLNAAAAISQLALGDPDGQPSDRTYSNSGYLSQRERVEGAPYGTRGGISVIHNFPANGEYVFRITFIKTAGSDGFFGQLSRFEQVDLSINGQQVALLSVDQWMEDTEADGISVRTDPILVSAGPQRVTAAFVKNFEGPVVDLMGPHEWSLADRDAGLSTWGLTMLPHVQDLVVSGPFEARGVTDTPTRRKIFTCRPAAPGEERSCAQQILVRLGTQAYRRPLGDRELSDLLSIYDEFAAEGGFELGIQRGLQAIIASPYFIFRLERAPEGTRPGQSYPLLDTDLATRLSFFLWGSPPDQALLATATRGELSDPDVLVREVRRMLADPRAEALATRFAAQWLRLQDLSKVNPDSYWFPDYDQQLADAMRRETELFFFNLVREDRSLLELYNADYTFVNARLAQHYGIAGVAGDGFQRVSYPDDSRRGLLGHGSILVLTSMANRTSPVLRGKWVMEVLLGTPPPPPPPGVPDLEETAGVQNGRMLTTRQRMELHRASPVCRSCHQFMDPIGLALDNFDVTGRWRIRENGAPLDTRGTFYDGTPVTSPADLRQVLLKRPTPLVRTFTENLMTYALGRRLEHYDQATVRGIAREAEKQDYRLSSFVLGVVMSDAFRMKRADAVSQQTGNDQSH